MFRDGGRLFHRQQQTRALGAGSEYGSKAPTKAQDKFGTARRNATILGTGLLVGTALALAMDGCDGVATNQTPATPTPTNGDTCPIPGANSTSNLDGGTTNASLLQGVNANHPDTPQTPECSAGELQITDPNTLLFFQAAADYKDLNTSQKAIMTSYWNNALDQLQDIGALSYNSNVLETRENAARFGDNPNSPGLISTHAIKAQLGHIVQFKAQDGKWYDLGSPYYGPNNSVSYTKRNEHMIPGFIGGYAQVPGTNQKVFLEILPHTEQISKAQYTALKHAGQVEVEGNDHVGYYKVTGYTAQLFSGDHEIFLNGSNNGGYGAGTSSTADGLLSGGTSGGVAGIGARTGDLAIFAYVAGPDSNNQLIKYVRDGMPDNERPASAATITTITDQDGAPHYVIAMPDANTLANLPFPDMLIMK